MATKVLTTLQARDPDDDAVVRERIERLFEEAKVDPRKTLELKDELDHHGLWAEYRDRFVELVTGDPWF